MYNLLFILILFLCNPAAAQQRKPTISPVSICTLEGKKQVLNVSEKLTVLVFLSPSCPLSQKYTLVLNELAKEFESTVKFYGIFAEADPDLQAYNDFRKKYNLQFELYVDRDKKLVKSLMATVTPEAFVVNKGNVLYHGAIDDWAIALGKTKKHASVNFVRNAIQCAMRNMLPVPDYRKPVGCLIE